MWRSPMYFASILKRHPSVVGIVGLSLLVLIGLTAIGIKGEKPPVADAQAAVPQPASVQEEREEDAQPVERLWRGVVGLRNKCAVEGISGWNEYVTVRSRQRLEELNRQVWGDQADLGWSYFFARAMFEIARPKSDAPLVGFYHPWSDVWLLMEWQVQPKAKIVRLEMLCGEWVRRRGEPPFDLRPDWLRRDGFRVEQLVRATVENLRQVQSITAGKHPWHEVLRLDEQKQLLDEVNVPAVAMQLLGAWLRMDQLAFGAKVFDKDPPAPAVLQPLVESCDRFLKAAGEGKVGFFVDLAASTHPATAKTLQRLSPEAFGQLAPVYWLADPQWAEAFFVPDQNPDFCLALTYKRVESRLQLSRIDLVHFPIAGRLLQKEGNR